VGHSAHTTSEEMMPSTEDTKAHQMIVQRLLTTVATELMERARVHDASKLEEPEKSGYDELVTKLKGVKYGTDEYHRIIDGVRPAVDHHKSVNRHHPEFHDDGIWGMTLVDLVEMLCDWRAAGLRDPENPGDIRKSLDHAFERQRIPRPIYRILLNQIDAWWPKEG